MTVVATDRSKESITHHNAAYLLNTVHGRFRDAGASYCTVHKNWPQRNIIKMMYSRNAWHNIKKNALLTVLHGSQDGDDLECIWL